MTMPTEESPEPRAPESGGPAAPDAAGPTLEQLLAQAGAPPELGARIAATLGPDAAVLLAADPWLVLSVPGVRPDAADGFARSVLSGAAGPDDPRRGRAMLGFLLDRAALDGHTAQPADVLVSTLGTMGIPDPVATLQAVLEEGDVLAFSNAPESEDENEDGEGGSGEAQASGPSGLMISRERYAFAEEGIGESVQRLLATPEPLGEAWTKLDVSGDRVHAELRDTVGAHGLVLVATAPGIAKGAQISGFAEAAASAGVPVAIVGGNPVSVRTLNRELGGTELAALSVPEYLASVGRGPEDEAAVQQADTKASPKAKAKKADKGDKADQDAADEQSPEEGTENAAENAPPGPVFADPQPGLVIVSAAHLIPAEELNSLLEAVPEGMRVILAGDPAEPGPAGPGQPFRDLIDTRADSLLAYTSDGRVPRVRAADSEPHPLTDLRFSLREGELPPPENDPEKRLVIVPVRDAAEAAARAVQLASDSIPRTFGLGPADIQVVTIRSGGEAGAEALTKALAERSGGQARAMTAREALGGTWPAAVVVLDGPSSGSLTRALVYGLCGLGERHLSIVHGAGSALPQAVANVPDRPRLTRLPAVLRDL